MKAAFALLADGPTHNAVRKLAWQMYQKHGISLEVCRLPPHVSLKQPFEVSDLSSLEDYMAELTHSLPPIDIALTELQIVEIAGTDGPSDILWLNVEQTPELHKLHNRLNEELASRFGSTQADFDGLDYRFHMTIAIGGLSLAAYRHAYHDFKGAWSEIRFQAQAMALFAYDSSNPSQLDYISYKILPLSG